MLTKADLNKILDIKLGQRNEALAASGIELRLSDAVRKVIIDQGYVPTQGARPLERALTNIVLAPLAKEILNDVFSAGEIITADINNGVVSFSVTEKTRTEEELDSELVKALDVELAKDGAVDVKAIETLFGLEVPSEQNMPAALTESDLEIDYTGDIEALTEKITEQFKADYAEKNSRQPTKQELDQEKEQIRQALVKKFAAEKKYVNSLFKNLSLEALKGKVSDSVLRGAMSAALSACSSRSAATSCFGQSHCSCSGRVCDRVQPSVHRREDLRV